ncbi:P-loop containing nucleoside triphosphate hydrolase protein [Sphaerosporella brunnea]|uniref:P-loop containing nucleoside triphosphate hydrolase protein n=1 Tax=Sphaerosporella brunnea TaxID=1250544 RepID=A0A5J5F3T3_9PEZI|nr:P-loop containing nucleoside triphosphate hydrolase protein [Sphaerosporella brunnea]
MTPQITAEFLATIPVADLSEPGTAKPIPSRKRASDDLPLAKHPRLDVEVIELSSEESGDSYVDDDDDDDDVAHSFEAFSLRPSSNFQESQDLSWLNRAAGFADNLQAHRDRCRRGASSQPPQPEELLKSLLDDLGNEDDDAPVGHRTRAAAARKRRRLGAAELEAAAALSDEEDDASGEHDRDAVDPEEEIKTDRANIEAAAERLELRKTTVVVTRREEIVQAGREGVGDKGAGDEGAGDEEDEMEYINQSQLGSKEATRQFREVKETRTMYQASGMRTSLLDHQVLGVDWMVKHELKKTRPFGGLVADAMGLGKTIQSIATMCINGPIEPDDPKCTLIVAPPALLEQWKDEIQRHCRKGRFSVHIHHGAARITKPAELAKKDVVLCTYHAIWNSYPKRPKDRKRMTNKEYENWWNKAWDTRGVFHRVRFWRVILDECHIIKNRRGQISEACQHLRAVNTWALSGTPVQNSVDDIYPILSFLQHPTCSNWEAFRALVPAKASSIVRAQRVQALLKGHIMRRTKQQSLLGKPLITLPKKRIRMVELVLSEEEMAFYGAIEQQAIDRINNYMRKGTEMQHATGILVMLLRLRQVCDHPYLALAMVNRVLTSGYLHPIHPNRISNARNNNSPEPFDFAEFLRAGDGSMLKDNPTILSRLIQAAKDRRPGRNTTRTGRKRRLDDGDADDGSEAFDEGMGDDDDDDPSSDWQSSGLEFMHSSKTKAIQQQLAEWRLNHPNDKIVLFSQFTKMLDIIEKVLDDDTGLEWGYTRYQGGMSMSQRQDSLNEFRNDPHCHIMLMSIRAGGVGLNLVEANLIVCVDLWWNAAVELQAFDRVHRLGQKKEVYITRFVTKDTVEERILRLQKAKLNVAKAVLGEGRMSLGKLTREELLGLFGTLRMHRGRMVLRAYGDEGKDESDDDDDEE